MKTFFISDLHFGHDSAYKFTYKNGKRIRPWAENSIGGDVYMMHKWNRTIRKNDKVYVLGDVAIRRKYIPLLDSLNGKKILIRGNHDIYKLKDYLPYFTDIRGSHKLDNFILSHIPIHPRSIPRWCIGNIHGHLHGLNVKKWKWLNDKRYFNVSVESLNAKPIDFEEIKQCYK